MANVTTTIYPQRKNQEAWDSMQQRLEENGVAFNTFFNNILPNLADVVLAHDFNKDGYNIDLNLGTICIK